MTDMKAVEALIELLDFVDANRPSIVQALRTIARKNRADAAVPVERHDVKKLLEESARAWDELADTFTSRWQAAAAAGLFATAFEEASPPAPVERSPQTGDAVRLAAPWKWGAFGAQVGAIGTLDNLYPHDSSPATHMRIIFNRGSGPGTVATPIGELRATDETHVVSRVRPEEQWRIDPPARSYEQVSVPLWDWHPTE